MPDGSDNWTYTSTVYNGDSIDIYGDVLDASLSRTPAGSSSEKLWEATWNDNGATLNLDHPDFKFFEELRTTDFVSTYDNKFNFVMLMYVRDRALYERLAGGGYLNTYHAIWFFRDDEFGNQQGYLRNNVRENLYYKRSDLEEQRADGKPEDWNLVSGSTSKDQMHLYCWPSWAEGPRCPGHDCDSGNE